MTPRARTPAAYRLMHEGAIALSRVEAAGMPVSVDYLEQAHKDIKTQVRELEQELREDRIFKAWRKRYGPKTNLDSTDQLAKVLFGELGFKAVDRTATGKPKTDESALEKVNDPFVAKYLLRKKLEKARGTYIEGFLREQVDGRIHPVFNLHIPISFRSSCTDPNLQNVPVRNAVIRQLVRKAFTPPPGFVFVEGDFKGAEVNVAACYHKDPVMLSYLSDPSKDMHRDAAAKLFLCRKNQVSKAMRHCGKNMFVFPAFYGSYWASIGRDLWEAVGMLGLETTDGVNLQEHLRRKGFDELGELDERNQPTGGYYEHVRKFESYFWNKQFKVYSQWKNDWWEQYRERGWFPMHSGFSIEGDYRRNEVINYPVQGASFHCLLWVLIQLDKELRKRGMRSRIISQIHDSILAEVAEDELDDYLALLKEITEVWLPKAWPWLITGMTLEAEVAPPGGSWNDKQEVQI